MEGESRTIAGSLRGTMDEIENIYALMCLIDHYTYWTYFLLYPRKNKSRGLY